MVSCHVYVMCSFIFVISIFQSLPNFHHSRSSMAILLNNPIIQHLDNKTIHSLLCLRATKCSIVLDTKHLINHSHLRIRVDTRRSHLNRLQVVTCRRPLHNLNSSSSNHRSNNFHHHQTCSHHTTPHQRNPRRDLTLLVHKQVHSNMATLTARTITPQLHSSSNSYHLTVNNKENTSSRMVVLRRYSSHSLILQSKGNSLVMVDRLHLHLHRLHLHLHCLHRLLIISPTIQVLQPHSNSSNISNSSNSNHSVTHQTSTNSNLVATMGRTDPIFRKVIWDLLQECHQPPCKASDTSMTRVNTQVIRRSELLPLSSSISIYLLFSLFLFSHHRLILFDSCYRTFISLYAYVALVSQIHVTV